MSNHTNNSLSRDIRVSLIFGGITIALLSLLVGLQLTPGQDHVCIVANSLEDIKILTNESKDSCSKYPSEYEHVSWCNIRTLDGC